jgi:hypothetical protein
MQTEKHEARQRIETVAQALGVRPDARRKWFERGSVPARWQIEIVKAAEGQIKFADFEQIVAPKRAA